MGAQLKSPRCSTLHSGVIAKVLQEFTDKEVKQIRYLCEREIRRRGITLRASATSS